MSLLRTPLNQLKFPVGTFDEALDALYPGPLDFTNDPQTAARLYQQHAARIDPTTGIAVTSPSEKLSRRFLKSTAHQKAFLSGHVGGGKSTELRQLIALPKINKAFFPILLDIEPGYLDTLDVAQLLFLMSAAVMVYAKAHGLLSNRKLWDEPLQALDESLGGSGGTRLREHTFGVDVDLGVLKVKEELKFDEVRRQQFRELGANRMFVLAQLLAGLIGDLLETARKRNDLREPLLVIDGLDKVRVPQAQENTFRQKTSVLFEPPLRVVYTIPVGVAFHNCPKSIRDTLLHLYPAPTLKKAPGCFDPEQVPNSVGLDFLRKVLDTRVAPGIFDPAAVDMASMYSGGALRNFFWLLRAGIDLAESNNMRIVDIRVMRAAVKEARLSESQSLHEEHYIKLAKVHQTNFLPDGDAVYLDQSWVFECFNDKLWYEANPLLWKVLDPGHQ